MLDLKGAKIAIFVGDERKMNVAKVGKWRGKGNQSRRERHKYYTETCIMCLQNDGKLIFHDCMGRKACVSYWWKDWH